MQSMAGKTIESVTTDEVDVMGSVEARAMFVVFTDGTSMVITPETQSLYELGGVTTVAVLNIQN